MSRVLLLGLSPLPFENELRLYGPGIRTWQLTKPLLQDGHDVCLVAARIRGAYRDEREPVVCIKDDGLVRYSVAEERFWDAAFLQSVCDAFAPDAIVGATAYGSSAAAGLRSDRPFWADVFGDLLAEGQAKAAAYDDDYVIVHFWNVLRPVLDRADVFSSVSARQAYALLGALGVRGRLNKHSSGYTFVHPIPCGMDLDGVAAGDGIADDRQAFGDDFVVLWSGGYNTWADVDTLFRGLETAMARNPRVRFLSTGGQIDHHDEKTYPRLLRLIARSRFRDRFEMKGWLPTEEVAGYYRKCHVGVHAELPLSERLLGSQNRVVAWMQAGLPVVCTSLSEFGETIAHQGLGLAVPPQDPESLARALLALADDPERRRDCARRAQSYALEHLTFGATTRPLRDWAFHPGCAPDRGKRIPLETFQATPVEERPLEHYLLTVRMQGWSKANQRVLRHFGRRIKRALRST